MLAFYFNTEYKNDIILNYFLDWLEKNGKIKNSEAHIKFEKIEAEHPIQLEDIENKNEDTKDDNNKNNKDKKSKQTKRGRIDLFTKKDKNFLVIENKIKSKINGKKEDGYQLKLYKDKFSNTEDNFIGLIFVPNYNYYRIKSEEGYVNVEKKDIL